VDVTYKNGPERRGLKVKYIHDVISKGKKWSKLVNFDVHFLGKTWNVY